MQAMFVPALAAVHNFVSVHDRDRDDMHQMNSPTGSQQARSSSAGTQTEPCIITEEELGFNVTAEEKRRANERRDRIAKQMWVDYQAELQ